MWLHVFTRMAISYGFPTAGCALQIGHPTPGYFRLMRRGRYIFVHGKLLFIQINAFRLFLPYLSRTQIKLLCSHTFQLS